MKKKGSTLFTVAVFLLGIGLLLYPGVSNYWNSLHQSKAVAEYSGKTETIEEEQKKQMLREAEE